MNEISLQTGASIQITPNIATGGNATQSSDYHHTSLFGDPDGAHYAIDGTFSTDLNNQARCAITTNAMGAWWQLDLLSQYTIEAIGITTRENVGKY